MPLSPSYLSSVSDRHRKAFGQFFTPPKVAEFMMRWILNSPRPDIHEPGFGLGAFFDAAPAKARMRYTGSEIDWQILDHWLESSPDTRANVREEDYLLSWGRRHGNIVCNPPYMRFQKFTNRDLVFEMFEHELGVRLSGYTNTASAFLLKSLSELKRNGRLAYVMPLEFLNTGYGTIVKERLIAGSHLAAMISLDCEKDVFPDAITSAGIILYDSSRIYSNVEFRSVESIDALQSALEGEPVVSIPYDELDTASKWLPYFERNSITPNSALTVPLTHYGRFTRGIATGANEFFVLRPSRAGQLGLTAPEISPTVTKSVQIQTPFFTSADYDDLLSRDEPVLLFTAGGSHSERAGAYIRFGESQGYHQRFLTKNRTPWYKTEARSPAPLLLGVFSRGGYKIIRNESDVLNLTCFHGFYPNLHGAQYLDHLFLYLNSSTGREIVSLSARRYGDGLSKFEPNDLNTALVPSPEVFDAIPPDSVTDAMRRLKETGTAPDCVESWFRTLRKAPA